MGARGPRPQLAEVVALKGNPGKRPVHQPTVKAQGLAFVPEHLHADARACIEVVRDSMPPATYAKVDSFVLGAFATAWAIHKHAVEALAQTDDEGKPINPLVEVGSQGNRVPSPWVKIINQQAQLIASLGDRLGLDPKSRAGLKLPDEKPRSKFEGLTGGASKAH